MSSHPKQVQVSQARPTFTTSPGPHSRQPASGDRSRFRPGEGPKLSGHHQRSRWHLRANLVQLVPSLRLKTMLPQSSKRTKWRQHLTHPTGPLTEPTSTRIARSSQANGESNHRPAPGHSEGGCRRMFLADLEGRSTRSRAADTGGDSRPTQWHEWPQQGWTAVGGVRKRYASERQRWAPIFQV